MTEMLPLLAAIVLCPFFINAGELPREHIGNRLFVRYAVLSQDNGISFYTLSNIRMPRTGARIYDRLMVGTRLFIPVSVIDEMFMLAVDIDDHSVEMHSIDHFSSPSGEPPRNTSIFRLQATNEFALFYLRPAKFSDRPGRHGPRTGLVGEHVCTVVCAETFKVKKSTVIAGFEAETAATHNYDVAQVDKREFLFAHTEVDRIHQRHLNGAYENYVGSFLTRWKIDEAGTPLEIGRRQLPFISFFTLAVSGNGDAILLCNEARQDDPLFIYRFNAEDIRGNLDDR